MTQDEIDACMTNHYMVGDLYVKEWRGKAGMCVAKHRHDYDHLSYLVSGRVVLRVDGVETKFTGPIGILIKANALHEIVSLTDDVVWLCIHSAHAAVD